MRTQAEVKLRVCRISFQSLKILVNISIIKSIIDLVCTVPYVYAYLLAGEVLRSGCWIFSSNGGGSGSVCIDSNLDK